MIIQTVTSLRWIQMSELLSFSVSYFLIRYLASFVASAAATECSVSAGVLLIFPDDSYFSILPSLCFSIDSLRLPSPS